MTLQEMIKRIREGDYTEESDLSLVADAAERSLKLEAENKILKDALGKYADKNNYAIGGVGFVLIGAGGEEDYNTENWKFASNILEKLK